LTFSTDLALLAETKTKASVSLRFVLRVQPFNTYAANFTREPEVGGEFFD